MEAPMNRLKKYGSDYVKKLRSYNSTLLNREGVVQALEFAGRDIGSLRLFLDDMREGITFPPRMVTEIGYPYIDQAFLKSYIKMVQSLRKTKKELPKPMKVAEKVMADYFLIRKKAIARQKKCSVNAVLDRDVFYPTSAEVEKNKGNYLQVGNPNYALSYILSNMISREIELIKKNKSKDKLPPLIEENVHKEIQSAFSKYHEKYVLSEGKILRCNLNQKGVYFGDDFYLKEGKITTIDTTKKVILNGLIIDVETNEIENPMGIPEENIDEIRNKIKNKKLKLVPYDKKGRKALLGENEPIFIVKEGKEVSVFELMCEQNGEDFARAVRDYDTAILTIPNILNIVKYIGSEANEWILEYLLSLKSVQMENINTPYNVLTHLFMAGYVPYYNKELADKYIDKINALVPLDASKDVSEQDVSVPANIAMRLASEYLKDKRQLLAQKKECDESEIKDIDLLCVTSLEEQDALSVFYRDVEKLCTFGTDRYMDYYMINAIKRNIDKIKRAEFPRREDIYGTSSLSIQVLKRGGKISIKNRYNHTVSDPDNTYFSNPNHISKGLTTALKNELGVSFETTEKRLPYHYQYIGKSLFKSSCEINGIIFGENCYSIDGKIYQIDERKEILVENYLINLKEKTVISIPERESNDSYWDRNIAVLKQELEGKRLEVRIDKKTKERVLFADGKEVLRLNGSRLVELTLPSTTTLADREIVDFEWLKCFTAPHLTEIGEGCISCPNLRHFSAPHLKKVGRGTFCGVDFYFTNMQVDTLKKQGFFFISKIFFNANLNEFSDVASYDENFAIIAVLNQEIKGKKVTLKEGKKVKEVYANGQKILSFEKVDQYNWNITYLNLPTIRNLPANALNRLESLKEARFENLEVMGKHNIVRFRSLKKLYIPHVQKIEPLNELDFEEQEIVYNRELLEKNGIIKVGSYLIDTAHSHILNMSYFSRYDNCIANELKDKKLAVEKNENSLIVKADGVDILTFKDGHLLKIHLPTCKRISYLSLDMVTYLEEISAPLVEEIDNVINNCPQLKRINIPHLKKIANSINSVPKLEEIDFKEVESITGLSFGNVTAKRISLPKFETTDFSFPPLNGCVDFDVPAVTKNNCILFAGLIIDQNKGQLETVFSGINDVINNELKDKKITIQDCEGGRLLCADGKPVLKEENGCLTGLYLNQTEEIKCTSFFNENPYLKEFVAPNLKEVNGLIIDRFLCNCPQLEKIECPNLETVSGPVFCGLEKVTRLSLPKLKNVSCYGVLSELPNLVELNVPELKNVPFRFLDKTPKLEVLNAPLLNNRLKVLRYHPNKRKILKKMQQKKDVMMHLKYAGTLAK